MGRLIVAAAEALNNIALLQCFKRIASVDAGRAELGPDVMPAIDGGCCHPSAYDNPDRQMSVARPEIEVPLTPKPGAQAGNQSSRKRPLFSPTVAVPVSSSLRGGFGKEQSGTDFGKADAPDVPWRDQRSHLPLRVPNREWR